ncbi:MAG: hypothetical protein AAB845_01965 [Patescibacteria group bacterium]
MSHLAPEANESQSETEQLQKIQTLREMVLSAEKTIQSAKAMLLQIEGKKKTGRPRKLDSHEESLGTVIEGTFDGQIMIGTDGKQYPVPANYASKSKLVEGDMLKLTITGTGTFLYKQIGPIERRHALGIVTQDENSNYYVVSNGKPYRILLASVTYFKAEPGDEVAIVVPAGMDSTWAAIENIIQKGVHADWKNDHERAAEVHSVMNAWKQDITPTDPATPEEAPAVSLHDNDLQPTATPLLNDWVRDMEEIEREINQGK